MASTTTHNCLHSTIQGQDIYLQVHTAALESSIGTISLVVNLHDWQKPPVKSRPVNISQCMETVGMQSCKVIEHSYKLAWAIYK